MRRAHTLAVVAVAAAVVAGLALLSLMTSGKEEDMRTTLPGDSLIEWGDWDSLLEGEVTNHGRAGETTGQIAARVGDALSGDEDYVVLWAGTNDIGMGLPLERTRADLVDLLATVGEVTPGAEVLVLAVPPLEFAQPQVDAVNAMIAVEAAEAGATFLEVDQELAGEGARSPD